MLSDRDRTRLIGVHPTLVSALTLVLSDMEQNGHSMFVVEGVRTAARQAALYAEGRTQPGVIVTYKDGVLHKSNHQPHNDGFGYAVDCAFSTGEAFGALQPWEEYGESAENHGLQWGGRWKMVDAPHVELLDESTTRLA